MWSDEELHLQDAHDHRQPEHHHHIGVLSNNSSEGGGDGCDLDSTVPNHLYETKPLTLGSSHNIDHQHHNHHLGLGATVDHQKKMERTSSPRRPPLSSNSSMDNMRATLSTATTNSTSNMSPQGRSSSFG